MKFLVLRVWHYKKDYMELVDYIFPSYYYIVKASDLFYKTPLENSTLILINTLDNNVPVYTINESIAEFLSEFRKPCSFKHVQAKYSWDIEIFFNEMVTRRYLLPFGNEIKDSRKFLHCKDLKQISKEFGDYTFIQKLNDKDVINVIEVEDQNCNKYVIKYLEYNHSFYEKSLHSEYLSLKILESFKIAPRVIKFDEKNKYLVMEYIHGESLLDYIRYRSLNIDKKSRVADRIIACMALLHERGVVHGDIHARQFIIDHNGFVFLLDFGYSYLKEQTDIVNIVCGGIYNYIEPENLEPNVFHKYNNYIPSFTCDVYRIGVLLYYLFWERFPFDGYTWKGFCANVKNIEPQFDPFTKNGEQIPDKYINLIKICLSKNSCSRPESAIMMDKMINCL